MAVPDSGSQSGCEAARGAKESVLGPKVAVTQSQTAAAPAIPTHPAATHSETAHA